MSKVRRMRKGSRIMQGERMSKVRRMSKVSRVSNSFSGMHYFHMKGLRSWDLQ